MVTPGGKPLRPPDPAMPKTAPFGVLRLKRWRVKLALAARVGQSPAAVCCRCARASSMRTTAALRSRFAPKLRSMSEISVGSLKLDHHSARSGVLVSMALAGTPPSAVRDQVEGTAGLGGTKFGPTAQLASSSASPPIEARGTIAPALMIAGSWGYCSRLRNIHAAPVSVNAAITAREVRAELHDRAALEIDALRDIDGVAQRIDQSEVL